MRCRLAIASVGLLFTTGHTYVIAPIVFKSHQESHVDKALVLMPKHRASNLWDLIRSSRLSVSDATDKVLPLTVPYFTVKPDQTISWDDFWCIEAGGDKSGAAAFINRCTGSLKQKWSWIPDGQGQHMMQLKDTNECLDVRDNGDLHGAAMELRNCADKASASWRFQEQPFEEPSAHSQILAASSTWRHFAISFVALAGFWMLSLSAWLWQRHSKARVGASSHRGASVVDVEEGLSLTAPLTMSENSTATRSGIAVMNAAAPATRQASDVELTYTADETSCVIIRNERMPQIAETLAELGNQFNRFKASTTAARLAHLSSWFFREVRGVLAQVGDDVRKNTPQVQATVDKLEAQFEQLQEADNYNKFVEIKDEILKTLGELKVKLEEDSVGRENLRAMLETLTSEESQREYQRNLDELNASATYKHIAQGTTEFSARLSESLGDLLKRVGDGARENLQKDKSLQKLEGQFEELQTTKAHQTTLENLEKLKATVTSEDFKANAADTIEVVTPKAKAALVYLLGLLEEFDSKCMTEEKVQELQITVTSLQKWMTEGKPPKQLWHAFSSNEPTNLNVTKFQSRLLVADAQGNTRQVATVTMSAVEEPPSEDKTVPRWRRLFRGVRNRFRRGQTQEIDVEQKAVETDIAAAGKTTVEEVIQAPTEAMDSVAEPIAAKENASVVVKVEEEVAAEKVKSIETSVETATKTVVEAAVEPHKEGTDSRAESPAAKDVVKIDSASQEAEKSASEVREEVAAEKQKKGGFDLSMVVASTIGVAIALTPLVELAKN